MAAELEETVPALDDEEEEEEEEEEENEGSSSAADKKMASRRGGATSKKKSKKKNQPGKYSQLVVDTIRKLGERNGSSLAKIYNEAKKVSWFDQQNGRTYLKYSVKALVQNDTLVQVKGIGANGSFKLNRKKLEGGGGGGGGSEKPAPAKRAAVAAAPRKTKAKAAKKDKVKSKKSPAKAKKKKEKKSAKRSLPKMPKGRKA